MRRASLALLFAAALCLSGTASSATAGKSALRQTLQPASVPSFLETAQLASALGLDEVGEALHSKDPKKLAEHLEKVQNALNKADNHVPLETAVGDLQTYISSAIQEHFEGRKLREEAAERDLKESVHAIAEKIKQCEQGKAQAIKELTEAHKTTVEGKDAVIAEKSTEVKECGMKVVGLTETSNKQTVKLQDTTLELTSTKETLAKEKDGHEALKAEHQKLKLEADNLHAQLAALQKEYEALQKMKQMEAAEMSEKMNQKEEEIKTCQTAEGTLKVALQEATVSYGQHKTQTIQALNTGKSESDALRQAASDASSHIGIVLETIKKAGASGQELHDAVATLQEKVKAANLSTELDSQYKKVTDELAQCMSRQEALGGALAKLEFVVTQADTHKKELVSIHDTVQEIKSKHETAAAQAGELHRKYELSVTDVSAHELPAFPVLTGSKAQVEKDAEAATAKYKLTANEQTLYKQYKVQDSEAAREALARMLARKVEEQEKAHVDTAALSHEDDELFKPAERTASIMSPPRDPTGNLASALPSLMKQLDGAAMKVKHNEEPEDADECATIADANQKRVCLEKVKEHCETSEWMEDDEQKKACLKKVAAAQKALETPVEIIQPVVASAEVTSNAQVTPKLETIQAQIAQKPATAADNANSGQVHVEDPIEVVAEGAATQKNDPAPVVDDSKCDEAALNEKRMKVNAWQAANCSAEKHPKVSKQSLDDSPGTNMREVNTKGKKFDASAGQVKAICTDLNKALDTAIANQQKEGGDINDKCWEIELLGYDINNLVSPAFNPYGFKVAKKK